MTLTADLPRYKEVKAEILARIQKRIWRTGEVLPSEHELADEFDCARGTVNRAMRELSDDGVIERKRRAGTIVAQSRVRHARLAIPLVRSEIEATGAKYRYRLITRAAIAAPAWLRARMELAEAARVLHLQCLHLANAQAFQFEDRWINLAVVPGAAKADFSVISPNEWLINAVPFTDAEFAFHASRADKDVARMLQVADGDAVLVAERITWLERKPVTYARMSFPSSYRMVTRV